ncbi:MAG: hypothetical protein ACK56F_23830, partial [bacterium]
DVARARSTPVAEEDREVAAVHRAVAVEVAGDRWVQRDRCAIHRHRRALARAKPGVVGVDASGVGHVLIAQELDVLLRGRLVVDRHRRRGRARRDIEQRVIPVLPVGVAVAHGTRADRVECGVGEPSRRNAVVLVD